MNLHKGIYMKKSMLKYLFFVNSIVSLSVFASNIILINPSDSNIYSNNQSSYQSQPSDKKCPDTQCVYIMRDISNFPTNSKPTIQQQRRHDTLSEYSIDSGNSSPSIGYSWQFED